MISDELNRFLYWFNANKASSAEQASHEQVLIGIIQFSKDNRELSYSLYKELYGSYGYLIGR